jgi:hypothetical protein
MQTNNATAIIRLLLALACALGAFPAAAQAGPKAAIFPFELIDLSAEVELGGPRADETKRLELATAELRKLAREAGYEVLDLNGIASDIERAGPLYKCNECDIDLARRVGAEVAITVAVRKFSNLLLSLHIYEKQVSSGALTKMYRIDIRGNTDESWRRGVQWLVERGLARG